MNLSRQITVSKMRLPWQSTLRQGQLCIREDVYKRQGLDWLCQSQSEGGKSSDHFLHRASGCLKYDASSGRRKMCIRDRYCTCTVKVDGKTGVEMEALTGVSVALLTIYDMCKALDKTMEIGEIYLVRKSGGKSGEILNKQKDRRQLDIL